MRQLARNRLYSLINYHKLDSVKVAKKYNLNKNSKATEIAQVVLLINKIKPEERGLLK